MSTDKTPNAQENLPNGPSAPPPTGNPAIDAAITSALAAAGNVPPVAPPRTQIHRNELAPNAYNAEVLLTDCESLRAMLGWDELFDRPLIWHDVPTNLGAAQWPPRYAEPRHLTDDDLNGIQIFLQWLGLSALSPGSCRAAVFRVARRAPWHPIKTYLDGVLWDGVPRLGELGAALAGGEAARPALITDVLAGGEAARPALAGGEAARPALITDVPSWLTTYAGADDNEYTRFCGRMFLVAMMARIYSPGCKYDYMLILEGGQGVKKSMLPRILAGKWFTDSLPCDITSKDAAISLKGYWVIEIAELDSLKRAQLEAYKKFVTKQIEMYRPVYGTLTVQEPRTCVFLGTTNEDTYLTDTTGNRRFLPIGITKIDEVGLRAVRDQLLAEALVMYRAGEKWWPSEEFEELHAKGEQAKRMEVDPWADKILPYVKNRDRLSYSVIAENSLGLETKALNNFHRDRIKGILVQAGWKFAKYNGQKLWRNPKNKDEPEDNT